MIHVKDCNNSISDELPDVDKPLRVLVACEYSGIVREAFNALGHNALSCDLLPTEREGKHYQGNVLDIIEQGWDLMIAHPPCTYLAVSGNRWMKPEFKNRFPDRHVQRREAIDFFLRLAHAPIEKIAIENPVGIISSFWRKPDQYIHPYHFGDEHSKKTGLWLKNLPPLQTTKIVEPKFYILKNGKKDPTWHFESIRLPALERMKFRSRTFQGIADAMALQWGGKVRSENQSSTKQSISRFIISPFQKATFCDTYFKG